ncbi:MAG TPA: hypothetical protein VFK76_00830, partial [Gaiellaceae bacterium]|nr:hypothetical protein [Gaiellaceae bacterium]
GGTDLVVVNAAPLTRSPAALAWAKAADATLLVAQRGVTRRESVSDAAECLRRTNANLIGTILTGAKRSRGRAPQPAEAIARLSAAAADPSLGTSSLAEGT